MLINGSLELSLSEIFIATDYNYTSTKATI